MVQPLILASGSDIRAKLLRQADVDHVVERPRVDEEMIKQAMIAEVATPRDIADALAEMKARRVSDKHPGALVLGCDQVLDHRGNMLSKPVDRCDAIKQLSALRGDRHSLLSAAVLYEDGKPIWRHVGQVRLRMREVSDGYIVDYVARNWDSIQHTVGCYKLEEEGVRLFSNIEGDYFHVLGMPLLELLNYLTLRGDLAT
ncbi:MAG: Maf family protein [Sulfitobacter sp.]